MGILWSFIHPIFMLVVYTFVFSVVFKARWNSGTDSKTEFAMVLFSGLIVFNFFSECLNRAPGLIISNVNYVKKVVFPLEVLPWVSIGSALFHSGVSLIVWLSAYTLLFGLPHITALLLPIVIVPLLLSTIGISWALASLGVFLRDVTQLISIISTSLMFLSPIFYPVTALPEKYRPLLYINPMTPVVEQTRAMLYWGLVPDGRITLCYFAASLLIAWIGFAWFQKTRKGFADVI